MTLCKILLATTCGLMPVTALAMELGLPESAALSASRSEPMASAMVPVAPFANGKVDTVTVQGEVRIEAWKIAQSGLTTLQILDPLRSKLLENGYQVVLDCRDTECGGFDFRYEINLLPEPEMHVDLGDYRWLTLRKDTEINPPEYLSLMVSRSANTGFVQMTRVGTELAIDGAVVSSSKSTATPALTSLAATNAGSPATAHAADLADLLETAGRAPLDDLIFGVGSASLGKETFGSLGALSEYLKANPNKTVALVGHTDSKGSKHGNLYLSRERANSVVARLVNVYGIPKAQLESDGVGYLAPRATNQTVDGRTQNRRVEVILTSTQ